MMRKQQNQYKQPKQQEQENPAVVGKEILVTIKRMGINGEGVGYYKKQVVFIPGALPEEVVVAKITKVERGYAEAEIIRVKTKSPFRVKAPCPIYSICGGCQLQHIGYEKQLEWKRDIVHQALTKYLRGNIDAIPLHETIGMGDPWHYRNKSQLQAGRRDGEVIIGLYSLGTKTLVDLTDCPVQREECNEVTSVVKEIVKELDIPVYHPRKGGWLRTVVTRVAVETGEVQLVLVATSNRFQQQEEFVNRVREQLPNVVSIMLNVNDQRTSLVFGEKTYHVYGKEAIEETLGDLQFHLSARAFFQLNPEQTIKLYDEVKKAAELTGEEYVLDAYCGVGTIGLWLAPYAKEIRGMDTIEEAIEDAKENAKANGLTNTRYKAGQAEVLLDRWKKQGYRPDVVVVDPPRVGCEKKFIATLHELKPKRIVYVSCNPSSLARDLEALRKNYDVEYIQPLDMFPQTSHVESIAKLTLNPKY